MDELKEKQKQYNTRYLHLLDKADAQTNVKASK